VPVRPDRSELRPDHCPLMRPMGGARSNGRLPPAAIPMDEKVPCRRERRIGETGSSDTDCGTSLRSEDREHGRLAGPRQAVVAARFRPARGPQAPSPCRRRSG
jgi:hypothetical protein